MAIKKIKNRVKEWLLWSQKYTQTDMIYATKGGFWLLFNQITVSVVNILTTLFLVNLLTKETFGTYKFVLSFFGILSIPALSGLNTAIVNAAAKNENGAFVKAFFLKLKYGALGSLAGLVVALYYCVKGNNILCLCFLIAACFVPFFNSFSLYESFLSGKKNFSLLSRFSIITQLISLICLAGAVLLSKNIYILLLAYFLPLTLSYLFFFYRTKKIFQPQGPVNPQTVNFGKHLSIISIWGNISAQIDKIILWHFLGPAPLAIYAVAMMLPDKIKDILKIIGSLATPKLVTRPLCELKKSVPQKTVLLFFLAFAAMFVYIVSAPLLFRYFIPQYRSYVHYSQVYALMLLFYPRLLIGATLYAKQKTKEIYLNTIVLTPFYWLSLLIFTILWGIWGALGAGLITEALTFGLQWFQFKQLKDSENN